MRIFVVLMTIPVLFVLLLVWVSSYSQSDSITGSDNHMFGHPVDCELYKDECFCYLHNGNGSGFTWAPKKVCN
jgi:hypothetical protein